MPGGGLIAPIWPEEGPMSQLEMPPIQLSPVASAGYFDAMRIPILAGRTFRRAEEPGAGDEAVVNARLAAQFWNDSTGRTVIGKRFRTLPSGSWRTIVGVVGSVRDSSLQAPPQGAVYFPEAIATDSMNSRVARTMALVVRTTGDPAAMTRRVEAAMREVDPSVPAFNIAPMREVVARSVAQLSFTMFVLVVAAAVTLFLGAAGLYGVMAYIVSLRTREIGVRIALGAPLSRVAMMIAVQGVTLAALGLLIGLVACGVLGRFLKSFLYDVATTDPVAIAAVAMLLLLVAVVATWIPAQRAARVDPTEAFRAE
jgi:hypothetical protein